jgi:hypothetical protein
MNNNIALIIAAVIVAVGLALSNGVYLMSGAGTSFAAVVTNKFTGSTCFVSSNGWGCH